ncbi:hypothetical protein POTOM_050403 [Populus tomentosa]|uniref:SPIRAL1-like1 n=1 Tax=Populus tomentosa TaxID=118781 RepID=A0A8X7YC56_POPTO|nr:hypothetical protein POTOM_050403 [Populus tomentosa]
MGRGVSSGGGQSSLGYLFGGGEAPAPPVPKPTNTNAETPQSSRLPVANEPGEVSKQIPAGVPAKPNTTNNYFRADGQNCGNFLTAYVTGARGLPVPHPKTWIELGK